MAIGAFNRTIENKSFLPKEVLKSVLAHNQKTVEGLQKQLVAIEKLLQSLVKSNPVFKQQQDLLMSIPGVGMQTTCNLIAVTNAFTPFKDWRKLTCYYGVAPFKHQLGSSIKGKTKMSHIANKKMKSLLNMAALAAKKSDTEIKAYYERKVAEGKNKMKVMNAIRCKITSGAFAVIERKSPFINIQKFKTAS